MSKPTRLSRHRRYVVAATAEERDALRDANGDKRKRGYTEHVFRTLDECLTVRGLPVDGFELTAAAEQATNAADVRAALESDRARTAAGTL